MQRRWEDSSPVTYRELPGAEPRQHREPGVQLISKIVTASALFRAKLVIDGSLSSASSWPSPPGWPVSAPVLRLAQICRIFHQARLSVLRLATFSTPTAEPTLRRGARAPRPRNIKFAPCRVPLSHRRTQVLHDVTFDVPAADSRDRRAFPGRQEHVREARPAPYVPESGGP